MRICLPSFKLFASTMSGQAKILSFFSPQQKRPKSHSVDEECENKPKKAKTDCSPLKNAGQEKLSPPNDGAGETPVKDAGQEKLSPKRDSKENENVPLSPEQKQRMEENKQKALAKRLAKQTSGLLVGFGESWHKALQSEFTKPYFESLNKFVETERSKGTVYPPAENVFTWTRACTVHDVKVVILGQDPYHGPNQAHGLSFSVLPGVPPPPSLVNMYKELATDIEGFKSPGHGYLMGWAKQGVLMLNAVLTVRAHQANSHKDKGWERLTDATISYLNKNRQGLVFILWGSYAQKKGAHIDKKKHHVLTGVHPSPLSAHRGFFGCKHFSRCNELLKKDSKTPIDWADLPDK